MVENKGAGLLERYDGSMVAVLKKAFPEEQVPIWRYQRVSLEYWKGNPVARLQFFDFAAQELGLTNLDGWYSVSAQQFESLSKAFPLERLYKGSLPHALQAVYPGHEWKLWRFPRVKQSFWELPENRTKFVDDLKLKFGITSVDGLYAITREDITAAGGMRLRTFGSSCLILTAIFPRRRWTFAAVSR